jgi:tight adherence protein B
MRFDFRLLLLAALVAVVVIASESAADAAEPLRLTDVQGARFPERSFVLSLPGERALTAEQVRVTEDGAQVDGLTVTPGGAAGRGTFGVVLAIDASDSMRGRAIEDAMAAARGFAARRQPSQPLGVVFFSRTPRLALAPTTDAKRIAAVLSAPPRLTTGTHILDATDAALDMLRREEISAGSVVLLSDGADSGSKTSPAALSRTIDRAGARVYSVGLRSGAYDGEALREIAKLGGGDHAETSSSKDLAAIFDALGQRLANQYLLEYRSQAALGAPVQVRASVDSLDGVASAVYTAPSFKALQAAEHRVDSAWTSPYAPVVLALLMSAVVGFVTFGLVRPGRRSVRSRIAGFVSAGDPGSVDKRPEAKRERPRVVAGAQRSLDRSRLWTGFADAVELARIDISPVKLACCTVGATVALAYLLGVSAGRPVLGVAALALPLGVRAGIRVRVNRERRAFGDQLAENLQVLASAMRAGHSFLGALAVMVDDAGEPSRREFRRVLSDEQLGVTLQDALNSVARRMRNPDVEYVGLVAQLQSETGGNTAEVLDRVTETIRERNGLERLVRTLTAQGRLGGWVVSLMPVGLVLALNVINPNYLDPLLQSGGGQALLGVGVLCIVTGMFAIRRIVDIKI